MPIRDLQHVLLSRPNEFTKWSRAFQTSVRLVVEGEIDKARDSFALIDGDALKYWFHLSAQNAGRDRLALLSVIGPIEHRNVGQSARGLRMPPQADKLEALRRDNWSCRYCGSPLLFKNDFLKFRGLLGEDFIPLGSTNLTTHGTKFLHFATFDHLDPHVLGGDSSLENVVSSCYACNFGKYRYTLEELRLAPPAMGRFSPNRQWIRTVEQLRAL